MALLVIDAQATDADNNVVTASAVVTVNDPAAAALAGQVSLAVAADAPAETAGPREDLASPGAGQPADEARIMMSGPLGPPLGHKGGEIAPLPGVSAIATTDPQYKQNVETSRQLWSGWASR